MQKEGQKEGKKSIIEESRPIKISLSSSPNVTKNIEFANNFRKFIADILKLIKIDFVDRDKIRQ